MADECWLCVEGGKLTGWLHYRKTESKWAPCDRKHNPVGDLCRPCPACEVRRLQFENNSIMKKVQDLESKGGKAAAPTAPTAAAPPAPAAKA